MKVVVYTSPACSICHQLIDFLNVNQINFKEIVLRDNQKTIEKFIKKTKQMNVPVIEIDREIILGFDIIKIKKKLNIK